MATLLTGNVLAEERAPARATAAAVASSNRLHRANRLICGLRTSCSLFTSEQLNRILSATFLRDDIEEVEVEGEREHP